MQKQFFGRFVNPVHHTPLLHWMNQDQRLQVLIYRHWDVHVQIVFHQQLPNR